MSMNSLQALDLPTSRDENWKYANLKPLAKVQFAAAAKADAIPLAALPAQIQGYTRYTFVDGRFAPELSDPLTQMGIAFGVTPAKTRVQSNKTPDLRFALLNEAFATHNVHIAVTENVERPTCIELVFVATADSQSASSYPRVELAVHERARLGLIERHVSIGSDANFVNSALEIDIAAHSHVNHYRVQQTGAKAAWFDTLSATVAADAAYQLYLINLGALSARSTMHLVLNGPRAELGLHSASVADGRQTHDAYALVEHAVADTRSRQSFRGIAAGRSRVAFNSKVVVREGASGSDSYQSLRGLLAGAEAEIDVRPQLEIYTDDVRCAHGATAGKLDEAMMFYLLSRGLDRETAQRLLKWAFLEDVVAKITVPELRRQIEQSLAGQLNETAVLTELL